jgi:beta-galactosidase
LKKHARCVLCFVCLIVFCLFNFIGSAIGQGTTLAPSKRVVINLGQTPWQFIKDQDPANAQAPGFNDSGWQQVGIPYSADQLDTFINTQSGGGAGFLSGTVIWYRKHFTMDPQYANSKVEVVFEGAHTGAQVYINGQFLPGNSAINPQATHVVGFVPFIVDLTPYLKFDGSDNVLAVRVAKNANWFVDPGFSGAFRFGQSDSGLFRPTYMYITDPVHIPQNIYAGLGTWGTYVNTVSASATTAQIEVQTNVLNEGTASQDVTLTTQIVDAQGNIVATEQDEKTLPPTGVAGFAPHSPTFDQMLTVNSPTLWYPNNSIYGKPYMYKVFHTVSINGVVIDAVQSPLGIRTLTWDKDYPYFNGKPQHLWGAAGRYDYPALGTSVPEEQQWRDLQQLAAAGGNLWRPGHSTSSEEFVNAADALGIMIVQPSGDGENSFANQCDDGPTCDRETLKKELHRDMIVRDRNHPSILAWEADNGQMNTPLAQALKQVGNQWDNLALRAQSDRTPNPANGDILSCSREGCDIGVKQQFPDNPAWGAEYWGTGTIRQDYDNELSFAAPYVDSWSQGVTAHVFGLSQWYFADSPGEIGTYTDLTDQTLERSIGDSMTDFNRFPRLLYYIDEANWVPYQIKPMVKLANTWNRTGSITVNAFSNCPAVRLLINGVPQGADQAPNLSTSVASNDGDVTATQTTTSLAGQVHWNVTWAAGTVTAACLDSFSNVVTTDQLVTAGNPDHIELDVVPDVVRPDGTSFAVTANGSDTAFVVAKVVDANGVVVPTASNNITFSVTGPGTYFGGTQQLVTPGQPLGYHSPGDPELQAEGGLQKIAIRSQFTTGTVTITATSAGLGTGTASYTIHPVAQSTPAATTPSIIAQPVSTAVTVGQPAHFSVTASGASPLTFQWSENGSPISGATGTTLDTAPTTNADNNAAFSVVVSNSLGKITSNNAMLTVDAAAAPAITAQPVSQVASAGQTVTFSVTASGSPTLQYQWRKNGAPIAGATNPTYTTPVLTVADSGEVFTVVITNPVNTSTSTSASLTVNAAVPPTFTVQPSNVSALPGQPASFSVTIQGSAPITYQWQAGGSNVASNTATVTNVQNANGSGTSTLTIPAVQNVNVGTYTVIATNIAGSVTSAPATLSLAPPGFDLALGKTATASSYENQGAMPASAAFDGDPVNTRWGSAFSDPQWLEVDLGAVMTFNRVVLNWQNAYAIAYQIQVSNDNVNWQKAYEQDSGGGGTEDFTFPTQQARYVRMFGTQRATQYGYSLWEFSIYNAPVCGTAPERYTINNSNTALLLDNLSNLTWSRSEFTLADSGAQFTQSSAITHCAAQGMRIPTRDEAIAISGANAASCAFPNPWSTWTSTVDPNDSTRAYTVSSAGAVDFSIIDNSPGGVLCTQGPTAGAPTIAAQPTSVTANAGQPAQFNVVATTFGTAPATYEWFKNGTPVSVTGVPFYVTPAVADADNNAQFSVTVTGGNGLSTASTSGVLTVTDNPVPPTNGGGGNTGGGTGAPGNTNNTDTAIPGFGTGPVPNGPNLAAGKTAASSGNEDDAAYPPINAIDGNLTTRWSSTFVDPSWIQIDLGSVKAIGQVVLRWERAFGVAYQIQTSTDGQNWTTAFSQTNGQGGSENLVFPSVNARYVRMYGTQRSSQYGYSLWEFEVYGPVLPTIATQPVSQTVVAGSQAQFTVVAGGNGPFTYQWMLNGVAIVGATNATYTTPASSSSDNGSNFSVKVSNASGSVTSANALLTVTNPAPGVANLALGKSTTSSGNENDGLGPLNAVDGDLTTRWSSAFSDSQWLEVDLGAPTIINKVVLFWQAAYGKAYQIQVSNDEQSWTTVYTQTAGQGGVETLTFPTVINRFIRFLGTSRATQYGYSLFEFQVFGADVPSITTQPASQTLNSGATAVFTVAATGDGPFAYQWLRNGVAIPGATATSYTTPALMSADNGSIFTVNVANANGTTSSQKATVTVNSGAPAGVNLALNQPTKESGSQDDGTLGSANAVDGNLTTRWSSAFVDPSWIEVDLGSTKTIAQVILRWENAYGMAYQIQVSNDEQTWTPAFTQTRGQGGVENITFPPVSGRYVRMFGTARATQYGYSLYEFEVYGAANAPTIATQPASQTVNTGATASFTVVAGGAGPFTYQWLKNKVAIPGATAASYTTPALAATDNGEQYSVTVGNASGTVNSMAAILTVNNSGSGYTIYPGFVGVDLNNNTNGAWADNQVFVTVIGIDPGTNKFGYLTPDGTIVDFTLNDSAATNHLTKNGQNYGNYSFSLAQSKLLKIPTFISARAYVSLGEPLYVQVNGDGKGGVAGYAGPNPQNATDPNINVHYDWYEFNNQNGIFINTTQVDQFGLPLLLDVWGAGGSFHQQVGITETVAQIDSEFASEVPAQFQPPTMSNLRILSPSKLSMAPGGANANYFDSYIASSWASFNNTPLLITLNGRQFSGTTTGQTFTFTEVNPAAANAGETFIVSQPSTQDVLECAGTMATGVPGNTPQLQDENAKQLQLQNQVCSAINRHVLLSPADWTNVSAYYGTTPANFYSQFWHKHSIRGLAYGFSYDDNNNQSTTVTTPQPEHMAFGIGW